MLCSTEEKPAEPTKAELLPTVLDEWKASGHVTDSMYYKVGDMTMSVKFLRQVVAFGFRIEYDQNDVGHNCVRYWLEVMTIGRRDKKKYATTSITDVIVKTQTASPDAGQVSKTMDEISKQMTRAMESACGWTPNPHKVES